MEAGFIPRLEQQCCSLGVHWDHPLILIIISWHQSLLLSHCTIHHTGPSITLGQPSHWTIHHMGPTITLDHPSHGANHHTGPSITLGHPSHWANHHTEPSITLGQPSHWTIYHTGPTITLDHGCSNFPIQREIYATPFLICCPKPTELYKVISLISYPKAFL